jgi:hypothetical protein
MRKHQSLVTGIRLALVTAIFIVSALAAQPFQVQPFHAQSASAQVGCPPGWVFYPGYGCVPGNNGGCPVGQSNYGAGCVPNNPNACPNGFYNPSGFGCVPLAGCPYGYSNFNGCAGFGGCTQYINGVCTSAGTCTQYVNGVCTSTGTCTSYINGLCAATGGCTAYVNGVCTSSGTCTSYVNGVCASSNCTTYVNGYCSSTGGSCSYGYTLTAAGTCAAPVGSSTYLYAGCNEVITPASLQGSSNVSSLVSLVQPYGIVTAVWEFNNALHVQQAVYFTVAGAPTDTSSLGNSSSTFICVSGNGTFVSNG